MPFPPELAVAPVTRATARLVGRSPGGFQLPDFIANSLVRGPQTDLGIADRTSNR
jgi:hypothetical protein